MTYQLMQGDCLELMQKLPDNSIDMILCDLPYGTTQNKWDSVIPFDDLWTQYKRLCKKAIVLTSAQPFTTLLIASNQKNFKYCWVWDKSSSTGFLNAKNQPLRQSEDVIVFSYGKAPYYPIMETRGKPRLKGGYNKADGSENYGKFGDQISVNNSYYPTNIIKISNANRSNRLHPTQKPIALMEYLIKTYTVEGETVLDNCMGSGSTGVACLNTNRNFIGVEKDETYFQTAKNRIESCMITETTAT